MTPDDGARLLGADGKDPRRYKGRKQKEKKRKKKKKKLKKNVLNAWIPGGTALWWIVFVELLLSTA